MLSFLDSTISSYICGYSGQMYQPKKKKKQPQNKKQRKNGLISYPWTRSERLKGLRVTFRLFGNYKLAKVVCVYMCDGLVTYTVCTPAFCPKRARMGSNRSLWFSIGISGIDYCWIINRFWHKVVSQPLLHRKSLVETTLSFF